MAGLEGAAGGEKTASMCEEPRVPRHRRYSVHDIILHTKEEAVDMPAVPAVPVGMKGVRDTYDAPICTGSFGGSKTRKPPSLLPVKETKGSKSPGSELSLERVLEEVKKMNGMLSRVWKAQQQLQVTGKRGV